MRRYLSMTMLAIAIAFWLPIVMAPWLVVGPWRLIGRIKRHTFA